MDQEINTINLKPGQRIFKMSHGHLVNLPELKKKGIKEKMEELKRITLGGDTGVKQAENFKNLAKIGDLVYVCYGGRGLWCVAEIVSEAFPLEEEYANLFDDEWFYREIRPLYLPIISDVSDLIKNTKKIMPSGNSTFWEITSDSLEEINKKLFEPKFGVKITSDLKTFRGMNLNEDADEQKLISLLNFKKQIILQGPPGTGKTWRAQKLASSFLNSVSDSIESMKKTGQFEIVQFHPSYSYEDFVRGISINTSAENGGGPTYEGQNKIFGDLADRAFQNFKKSQKTNDDPYKNETLLDDWLDEFRQNLKQQIDNAKDGKIPLDGTTTYIFRADEDDCLRYRGDNWGLISGQRMLLKDIKQLYMADASTRKEIKENHSVSGLARQHSSYFLRVVELFRTFVKEKGVQKIKSIQEERKNYVLLIDEINRANLPAVFGELIYALEYRGEEVSTMYKVDGSNKFVIPPNLYIIGTMNTADRSVGHIDYAIRRRFAFVSIPPNVSVLKAENKGEVKDKSIKLFDDVAVLFDETAETRYLASDYSKEDVQIGHSYFLAENLEELRMKLKYEIKPILQEYVKDGILSEGAKDIIKDLSI
ncbi:McrB family protein [Peijinzhouia sedimentorum]